MPSDKNDSTMKPISPILRTINIAFIVLVFLLTLKSTSSFSQKLAKKTEYVSLTLTHSRRIPYNYVRIEFMKYDSVFYLTVYSKALDNNKEFKSTTFYKRYQLNRSTFNRIVDKLKRFDEMDLTEALPLGGKDGTRCAISFGTRERTISYNCWSPDYKTKERGLMEYYNVCAELIKLARLKIDDVL